MKTIGDDMLRLLTVLLFSLFAFSAQAADPEADDKAWAPGKPWPAHWGLITYPYQDGWNTVLVGFVNKVYDKGEAADTWLNQIPYVMQQGAAVEICMVKGGLLERAAWCKVAVVDQEILGSLNEDDLVAYFYPNHGTKRFSKGPGSDPRTTIRVFQKLSSGNDKTCWTRTGLVFQFPNGKPCFDRIDRSLVERLLVRDFGPRDGVNVASPVMLAAEAGVQAPVTPVSPSPASPSLVSPSPDAIPAQTPTAVDPIGSVVEGKVEASSKSPVSDGQ